MAEELITTTTENEAVQEEHSVSTEETIYASEETTYEPVEEPIVIDYSNPATAYCYDKETKEYVGTEPCQYDPLESIAAKKAIWLLPADATFVQPAIEPQEGKVLCWNGTAWELKEDHRQKKDAGGTPIEGTGTPYWLPGDTYETNARYVDTVGPLPENAILTRPAKSEEQLWADLRFARDNKLDESDYLFISDYPVTEEELAPIKQYRQALRDLPAQEGAPWDGGGEETPWPAEPVTTFKL